MTRVVVIGATGKQGGAVADLLLQRGHEVVAYVRSKESPAAEALSARGARLAVGDLADADALRRACAGADAVFGLSVPFGEGGKDGEVAQGRLLVDTVARLDVHLVYSSVRGGDRSAATGVDHADGKQLVEAYLRERPVRATVLGPVYFMENVLDLGFSRLGDGILSHPLTPGKPLDQVSVLDIAGMAVHAVENPDEFVGERIDIASDRVTGQEAARILSEVIGREIPYRQMPLDMVRQWAGEEVATMFENFESTTDFLDIEALHARYPAVRWHGYAEWAKTVDWDRILAG
ncbi:NmrA/HSCARG family protein [Planomonospora sp. ID82291]|uniref:NmrA/HSCARG family protein n=1 Tax=Planomonospora sp. ID82291 TaxID=2738136 RepID=UPI0018C37D18|nr:NmrA/HSCARG family protein [Planomonospora sp. ID82291]MBG0815701.1 NmrA/HSCARG family protein [Planomonospora sp. ID82291]